MDIFRIENSVADLDAKVDERYERSKTAEMQSPDAMAPHCLLQNKQCMHAWSLKLSKSSSSY